MFATANNIANSQANPEAISHSTTFAQAPTPAQPVVQAIQAPLIVQAPTPGPLLAIVNHIAGISNPGTPLNGGLVNPVGVAQQPDFARYLTIIGSLDFENKLHKIFYDQGCVKYYDDYDVNIEGMHVFVTALSFKCNKLCQGRENCRK